MMKKSNLYIGIMSGTSCDGIDLVLAEIKNHKKIPQIISSSHEKFSNDLKNKINNLINKDLHSFLEFGEVDTKLGQVYAKAVNKLIKKNKLSNSDIAAIGCHGQTVFHAPDHNLPFSIQLGDPNIISALTNIDTVCDFRRRDIALGGQGAPLVPVFHDVAFRNDKKNRAIINIGGIANISYLEKNNNLLGFDTGPGNTLMDLWAQQNLNKNFDNNGNWAKSGKVNQNLLSKLLNNTFFTKKPPKSTGREIFNLDYLNKNIQNLNLAPEDIQATLCEFTAESINIALRSFCHNIDEIYICGGGAKNKYLLSRIKHFTKINLNTTNELGIDPQLVEASAFSWLAYCHIHKIKFDLTKISGSKESTLLGGLYLKSI